MVTFLKNIYIHNLFTKLMSFRIQCQNIMQLNMLVTFVMRHLCSRQIGGAPLLLVVPGINVSAALVVCSSVPLVQRVPEWFTFLILWFLKLNVQLPYNSRAVLLGIYPRYMKIYVCIKTGFYMYSYKQIAALFIEVPNWKQLRYPSICGKKVKL